MNDIDLSGVLFEPIGGVDGWGADKFTGTFHGNGHKIVGLKIDDTGSYGYVGLFRAANGATITDLQIVGEVSGRDKYCGGLVGLSVGSYFSNCVVQVSLRGGQYTSLALRRCRTGRILSYLRVKQENLGRCLRAVARTSSESK